MTQPPTERSDAQERWDQYWAHGFLTSCADAFQQNYEGDLRDVWEALFAQLPDQAALLDLCTGNGAIAAIAADLVHAGRKKFSIDASDLAEIRPELALGARPELLGLIRFHPRTPAEDLPFATASLDCVVGQYAFEYTDTKRSTGEIARVLKPGGRVQFVVHHHESVILKTAREELRHADLILGRSHVFEHAADLLGIMAGATTDAARRQLAHDPEAERARHLLNAAAAEISQTLGASAHPELLNVALTYLSKAFESMPRDGLAAALAQIEHGRAEIGGNAQRLLDLRAAAKDAPAMAAIRGQMEASGLERVKSGLLEQEGARLVGWLLTARKPK